MLHYELFFGPMEITQRSLEVFEDILEGVTPLGAVFLIGIIFKLQLMIYKSYFVFLYPA